MELTPSEKCIVIDSLNVRIKQALENAKGARNDSDEYFEKIAIDANNLYLKFMGSDNPEYFEYFANKAQRFIIS